MLRIRCYECQGKGCEKCQGAGEIPAPDLRDVLSAHLDADAEHLGHIHINTLTILTDLEQKYQTALLSKLDFESRTALDKQEKAILQQEKELQELANHISNLKAVLRACSFALDCLKLRIKVHGGQP